LLSSVTMGHMSFATKWWPRLSAALTGAVLTLVVPAHAWAASSGSGRLVVEAVKIKRRSRGIGGFGVVGLLCCLAVVAVIVLIIVLVSRRRKRR
jgi:hypothetical protein